MPLAITSYPKNTSYPTLNDLFSYFLLFLCLQLLAIVDFHPRGLPEGWVKELVFRKTKEGLTRKDPVKNLIHDFASYSYLNFLIIIYHIVQYYTDPISSYTVRTLKSAIYLVETGNVPKRAFIQMISVHDLYSFDKSADLVIFLFIGFLYLNKITIIVTCNLQIIIKNKESELFSEYLIW